MNHITYEYDYFPEQWVDQTKHYRLTFNPGSYAIQTTRQELIDAIDRQHQENLTVLLTERLHLWEITCNMNCYHLQVYCNSINWLTIAILQHSGNPKSPIHSLHCVESWHTPNHPLPKE